MIGSLRGSLVEVGRDQSVVLDVQGVGYRVLVPAGDLARAAVGDPAFFHVHTHVRDDAIVLYGFSQRAAREAFEALIASHGIGPALALAVLSVHTPGSLRDAIARGDAKALTMVPGVGQRTAARLVLELEGKLDRFADPAGGAPAEPAAAGGVQATLRAALEGLGYGAEEIKGALGELPESGEVEELLRLALRSLSRARRGSGAAGEHA